MKSTTYLGLLAGLLMMGLTACDDDEIYVNPPIVDNANNIVVNPYPNWDKCLLPTVIEDLSAYPAALQEVIRDEQIQPGTAVRPDDRERKCDQR